MDRDPRENDGRMVPDRGESGEPEGKADGEKSTEKSEERCGRRGGGDEQDRESRTGTGSGGDTDDVGGCQRIPEDRLVDESCDPKPKSADESHDSARQAENREGTERHRIPGSQAR